MNFLLFIPINEKSIYDFCTCGRVFQFDLINKLINKEGSSPNLLFEEDSYMDLLR